MWESMSAKSFRTLAQPKNKFHAQKTTVNGVVYDSKKEAKRAVELQYLEKIGQIQDLRQQVEFVLQDGFVNNEGKKIRAIVYVGDFCYTQDGVKIIEDAKGFRTKEYSIKKKLLMHKYPEYKFIES